jgi:hypothetical protein
MTTKANDRLEAIRRASRGLRFLFTLIGAGALLGTLAMLFTQPREVSIAGVLFTGAAVTNEVQVLMGASSVLNAAVVMKLCFHLYKLFGLYAQGKIFTQQNVAQIRQVGISLLLLPVVSLLIAACAAWLLETSPGLWAVFLNSFPFASLIGGGAILPIAWVMDAGRELREEQELVI